MPTRIFLSYRRKDSAAWAGRVKDRLHRDFGEGCSFLDVDSIPLGENFVEHLNDAVHTCDVLLAVIGPQWLDKRDEHKQRRLDDPNDYVRIEIRAALQRGISVIPILVEEARIPSPNQLPKDIRELAFRAGLDVRDTSFHQDMDRLVGTLKSILEARSTTHQIKLLADLLLGIAKNILSTPPVAWAFTWAIASAAGYTSQFFLVVVMAAKPFKPSDTQFLLLLLLILAGVGTLLLVTANWPRKQSELTVAFWIGFFSAIVALNSVGLVAVLTFKTTVDLPPFWAGVAAVHMGTTFLLWMVWRRRDKTQQDQR